MEMRIVHVAPVSSARISGLRNSVPRLASAQAELTGVSATLINSGLAPGIGHAGLDVREWSEAISPSGALRTVNPVDLVVFHSTYLPRHARLASWLAKSGIPYVIAPRGGLTKLALERKWFKKKLGDLLFFNQYSDRALGFHLLTEDEQRGSRLRSKPSFVAGNGTDVPPSGSIASPGQSCGRTVLFIGRIDMVHKGIDLLLEACRIGAPLLTDLRAKVVLRGPASRKVAGILRRRIISSGLDKIVEWTGPVDSEEKGELFRTSDLFVHTSRFEGHPNSVLEAMAHGLPCLVTPGTNMAGTVAERGSGWTAEPIPSEIARVLIEALSSPTELRSRGVAARVLIEDCFLWRKVAAESIDGYRALLSGSLHQGASGEDLDTMARP